MFDLTTLFVVLLVLMACCLIMAVGLIKGKTFTSCGCASITYKGEKLDCSLCPKKDECSVKQSESA